mmetsp:Transcript_9352/g.13912  ORF Transcript_9352/g.13912 Transcript_9352/m.13912 type:complete len:722 (+) Transcript_9352:128-2293(+)|eukprot:scaffold33526_cov153-Skeletonema_dohrnii-CCMP3373.AAC.2
MTPEQELLDESALRILNSLTHQNNDQRTLQGGMAGIHVNQAAENNANDADGQQGGQNWTSYPTASPTLTPTATPTDSPTFQPTLKGVPKTVRGMMWYDANANGVRDSNVVRGEFNDVEYKFGVGGVQMMLRECDWSTKMPVAGSVVGASTTSVGTGNRGEPMIVNHDLGGGIYQFTNVQLERAYYVEATAPSGFNLTSGICNDDLVNQGLLDTSWACDNPAALTTGSSGVGSVNTGRSRDCIYVDRTGNVTGVINLGVMQIGDSTPLTTNVALLLNFDNGSSNGRRHLQGLMSRGTKVSTPQEEADSGYHRYLLSEFDRTTIGTVTAEVVAGNLDERLEANGVELDSVIPNDVMLGVKADGSDNELAVAMQVHGHYSPPPDLDFDFIVQDSINRDTDAIRRSLRDYNDNCRDQTSKVKNEGFSVEDFAEIHSMNGALQNRVKGKNSPKPVGGVFRQSCAESKFLPSYFETSLKELKARKVSEVKAELYGDLYVASENRGGLASWAIGPVAGFAGMIALLMGVFVFRRALGPRYADKYQEANKTEKVEDDSTANAMLDLIAKDKEAKRKSRGGGGDDDDSVDSAFYSDADEAEFDETDKERKMRRKKKEYEQAGGRRKGNRRSKLTASMKELNRSLTKKTKTAEKLSARHGSEDTDEKTSSEEGGSRERQKRASTTSRKSKSEGGSERRKRESERGERKKSSSSARRGRSSRSGGDNASSIV